MRAVRIGVAVAGLAVLAWGVVLLVEFAFPVGPQTWDALGWLLGGTLGHDLLLAPLVALAGFGLSRVAGPAWRPPLTVAALVSGVLVLLSAPLLWRRYGAPAEPGLTDGHAGLLISLGVVWVCAVLAGVIRQRRLP